MAKLLKLTIVITLGLITIAHSANLRTSEIPTKEEPLFKIPTNAKTPADSVRFFEWSSILYVIDSNYWDFIRGTSSIDNFVRRVSDHQQDHPEAWLRAFSGLYWVRGRISSSQNLVDLKKDSRLAYFIRFGIPSAYWEPLYEAANSNDTLQTYFYWWDTPDTGLAAQIVKDTSLTPLIKALVGDTLKSKFGKDLYPELDIATFPNPDSSFDIAVTVRTSGDRLTKETLIDERKLKAELSVFKDDSLVFCEEQSQRLGLTGLILSVTANDEDISLVQHFTICGLPSGNYVFKARLIGGRNNDGKTSRKFSVPSIFTDNGSSDVFLVDRYPVIGENVSGGFDRHGRVLMGRGSHVFIKRDTLSFYAEIATPPDTAFFLKVYLEAKKDLAETISGKFITSHDSADHPLIQWAGINVKEELEKQYGLSAAELPGGLKLVFARGFLSWNKSTALEASLEIGDITSGEYWLIIYLEKYDQSGKVIAITPAGRVKIEIKSRSQAFLGKF